MNLLLLLQQLKLQIYQTIWLMYDQMYQVKEDAHSLISKIDLASRHYHNQLVL